MSQKYYKTTAFDKLNKQWQKKLKKSGFADCEQDEDRLKVWSSQLLRESIVHTYAAKQEYYYMATQFLNDNTFDSNLERSIWEYHAEGISLRNISKVLASVKIKMTKEAVLAVVKRIRTKMYTYYNKADDK